MTSILNIPNQLIVNGWAGFGTSTPAYPVDVRGLGTLAYNGVVFCNTTSVATPAVSLLGGSGDRFILYPGSASTHPYSIGVNTSSSWESVPTGGQHMWYINGTSYMTLTSSLLTLSGLTFTNVPTITVTGGINWFNGGSQIGSFDSGVTLVSASYGNAQGNGSNVLSIVQQYVSSGATTFPVNNSSMGGDPMPGVYKQLFAVYNVNGTNQLYTTAENGTASVPGGWRWTATQALTLSGGSGLRLQNANTTVVSLATASGTSSELQVNGSDWGQLRMINGNYGVFWRNDGGGFYLLSTVSGSTRGVWNDLRPIIYDMNNGAMFLARNSYVSVAIGSANSVTTAFGTLTCNTLNVPTINTGLANASGYATNTIQLPSPGMYIFYFWYGWPVTGFPWVIFNVYWDGTANVYTNIIASHSGPQATIVSCTAAGVLTYSQGGAWWGWGSYQILYLKVSKVL